MIFHAIQRHTHTSCSAHIPENQALFAKAVAGASDIGVNILSIYVDAPGHTMFITLEADTVMQIFQFFDPMLELGDTEIKPVVDGMALLNHMQAQQSDEANQP